LLIVTEAAICATGCHPTPRTPVERGRFVYMTHCVVCHNQNPNLAGKKGPPIAGASRELLQARLLHLEYPPGYQPQRKSHDMRAFPKLATKIDDLHAFLTAAANNSARTPDGLAPAR